MATENFVGQKFGRLKVLARLGLYARCQCDCGATCTPRMDKLREGKTKSCGCLARELAAAARKPRPAAQPPKRKRSANEQRLANVHSAMLQRCTNPNDASYNYYGGSGITVCEAWASVQVFIDWALPQYRPGLWLERRDNTLGYSPENCAFVSPKRQGRNRRNTLYVEGEPLSQFAARNQLPYETAYKNYCNALRKGQEVTRYVVLHGPSKPVPEPEWNVDWDV